MCIVMCIKFYISQQRFSNRKGPLRASGPHTNKKKCERQFLSPQFFTSFSAKSIFYGSLQLHHTIPEYIVSAPLLFLFIGYLQWNIFSLFWMYIIHKNLTSAGQKQMAPTCFQEVNTAWNLPGAMLSLANKWELVSKPFIQKCGYAPQEITSGNS